MPQWSGKLQQPRTFLGLRFAPNSTNNRNTAHLLEYVFNLAVGRQRARGTHHVEHIVSQLGGK